MTQSEQEEYFIKRYSGSPVIAFGFHGCDAKVAHKVICEGADIADSTNDYDWLGWGKYFWEANPLRALEWAVNNGKADPDVIGACIDLSSCFNLLDSYYLHLAKLAYTYLEYDYAARGVSLPENKDIKGNTDRILRRLDCVVINYACRLYNRTKNRNAKITTVRGMFLEGDPLYPNAGIQEKNHIQVCVRDTKAILCYFYPRHFNAKKLLKFIHK